MKIAMKKNSAEFNLLNNNEYYFFFNLQGQAEIEMVYVKKWWNLFCLWYINFLYIHSIHLIGHRQ